MEEKIIKQIIKESNKWWFSNFIFKQYKERNTYNDIKKYLRKKQIIALNGLRRVGKTTLMFKIVEDSIKNIGPENIFYFSFDEFADIRIRKVIQIYETLLEKDITKGKYLFLFDEIQKVENWEEQLKRLYDTYDNIKFIISGSESLFIRKKSKESLAGRIFEFKIKQLSFSEFLNFREIKVKNIELQEKQLLKEFNKYILTSGFPELINEQKDFILKYINEGVIEKIIYRDLIELFKIKDPSILKSVFNIIYNNPGQIIEINGLASELNLTRQKLSEYLRYLEEAFLVKKLYNFSKNQRKVERKLKKYYPSVINPYLVETDFGKVFENVMVLELNADFFWRDSYKNEVDIVLNQDNCFFPIELKSGKIDKKSIKGMLKFQDKFNLKNGYVISYNIEKQIEKIKIIPFYKFLLKQI